MEDKEKNQDLCEDKTIEVANQILTEHKSAFEVLGNG